MREMAIEQASHAEQVPMAAQVYLSAHSVSTAVAVLPAYSTISLLSQFLKAG